MTIRGSFDTGEVEGMVPSSWLLDEKARRQQAEAECGRLREALANLTPSPDGGYGPNNAAAWKDEYIDRLRETFDAERECGRLREQLDALKRQQWSNQNRAEVAERGHKAALARDFEQRDTIKALQEQLDAARQALGEIAATEPDFILGAAVNFRRLLKAVTSARAALGVVGEANDE